MPQNVYFHLCYIINSIFKITDYLTLSINPTSLAFISIRGKGIGANGPGGALGTPNKEQNGANKVQNWGKKDQNEAFLRCCLSRKYLCKSKIRSKGAELFFSSIAPMSDILSISICQNF